MIKSPDPLATRSVLADWIELTCFVRKHGVGEGDLDSLLRLASDNDRERIQLSAGVVLEEEIAETFREALTSRVAEELAFRKDCLGIDYPFVVHQNPLRLNLRPNLNSTSHSVYLFMLLMSCARSKILSNSADVKRIIDSGRVLFHLCASFGVLGLLHEGQTFWFGFPRPDKSTFATALEKLSDKLGYSKPLKPPPAGFSTDAKDDQIDVVGWRSFGDRRAGTLVIVCQAATGENWDSKSVKAHLNAFTDWFERAPYRTAMPSLAIPFPCHHDIDDRDDEDYDSAVFNILQRQNDHHGVILDRLRITVAINSILNDDARLKKVGGFTSIEVFDDWIARIAPAILA